MSNKTSRTVLYNYVNRNVAACSLYDKVFRLILTTTALCRRYSRLLFATHLSEITSYVSTNEQTQRPHHRQSHPKGTVILSCTLMMNRLEISKDLQHSRIIMELGVLPSSSSIADGNCYIKIVSATTWTTPPKRKKGEKGKDRKTSLARNHRFRHVIT